ncbi:uroporphyrinogen decarboxylase family protein [Parasporobacterium paucivorans]|uniref:Uroporphyrinogen decarboxylase (URO-D) n=1 Tax=Parasporobacterium paucivorans DSM 15970 TaxID=1122934 RepID=A0A1M6E8H2_9FIRM|nr:uroporphyrinogen decarboxylase family protein [Parasporobacterium paucivorans]SHI81588.1 Uroporphyrinogen decarboxylase (URO-D) [Parasporobacterium paucivorans DSM 15970]
MLTKRQNLLETIRGGSPDRFVKQYEFLNFIMEAPMDIAITAPGTEKKTGWGITIRWTEGQIGSFPVHDKEHIVLPDISRWKEFVKAPSPKYSEEEWEAAILHANSVDRKEEYVTAFFAPGLFEQTHYLMGMENALAAYYEDPEAMHELIDYITEYELAYAKEVTSHIHPDALFHHDDWGSQRASFISPEMFNEFFLPSYKKIYQFYRDNGVDLIVHHCDSYAANLVPAMIEMGVDIWQGVMTTNNTPELIKKYGGQISFMGDIDSGVIDFPGWTREIIAKNVEEACRRNGKLYFIPSASQGLNISSFPGVYETTDEEIDRVNREIFPTL